MTLYVEVRVHSQNISYVLNNSSPSCYVFYTKPGAGSLHPKQVACCKQDTFFTINYSCIDGVLEGRDSSVGMATRYGLYGPGIESQWGGRIFRTRPDRPWGPPSVLYNGYSVSFPGIKRPERGF